MSLLERILASKRLEIQDLKATEVQPSTVRRGTLDVLRALQRGPGDPLRFVAEIKLKSPSAGELSRTMTVDARAEAYGRAGAAMVSVLCDGPFFGGSWKDVERARESVDRLARDVPILAKEFVLDEVQLDQARATGADAVLLIARIVPPSRLRELYKAARARDLHPVVEVRDETELATALECNARIIGVNARDLDTLAMDAQRTTRVLAAIPSTVIRIHLSGVKTEDDVKAVARSPADAVLVGEALMREADPEPRLRAFVAAACA
ncbi:MAG: indole-3-glycerol phosphate synthase TrpC [Polyangiaceae bacterium]